MTRSVRIHDFGGPEVLRIEDVETEQPGAGEARLRIRAIGMNRTEITLRLGRSPVITRTFPFDDIVDAHRFMEAGRQDGENVVNQWSISKKTTCLRRHSLPQFE